MRIAIVSGKGGVGKSSFASLLAYYFSLKENVLLIDFDLSGPSISNIFQSDKKILVMKNGIQPIRYSETMNILSVGYMIRKEDIVMWRSPKRISLLATFMKEEVHYKNVIIDSAPGIHEELILIECPVIIISTSNNIALQDAAISIEYFRQKNIPILGIVENMSGMQCADCSTISYIYSKNGCKQLADFYDIKYLGSIPYSDKIIAFLDNKDKEEGTFYTLGIHEHLESIYGKIVN